MAASTKKGKVAQGAQPSGKSFGKDIPQRRSFGPNNPDTAAQQSPSWNFASCDRQGRWGFTKERLKDAIWDTILPKLCDFERMTISDIFVKAKKQNHGIDLDSISSDAKRRLDELKIEAEAIHSLRLGGTLRLYGLLQGSIFSIIWYDDNHGDNSTCVCRSFQKHT